VKTGFDPMLERAPLGNLTPGKSQLDKFLVRFSAGFHFGD
jgi:hypothetical protein